MSVVHISPQCIVAQRLILMEFPLPAAAIDTVSLNDTLSYYCFGYSSDSKNNSSNSIGSTIYSSIQGLSSAFMGYSLTNAFEEPLTIYNCHKRFEYSERPTFVENIAMGIKGEEIDKQLKDWITLSVTLTRGSSFFGPTVDTVSSAIAKYDAKGNGHHSNFTFCKWLCAPIFR